MVLCQRLLEGQQPFGSQRMATGASSSYGADRAHRTANRASPKAGRNRPWGSTCSLTARRFALRRWAGFRQPRWRPSRAPSPCCRWADRSTSRRSPSPSRHEQSPRPHQRSAGRRGSVRPGAHPPSPPTPSRPGREPCASEFALLPLRLGVLAFKNQTQRRNAARSPRPKWPPAAEPAKPSAPTPRDARSSRRKCLADGTGLLESEIFHQPQGGGAAGRSSDLVRPR